MRELNEENLNEFRMKEGDNHLSDGDNWLVCSVILVLLPTGLMYIFDWISNWRMPNIQDYGNDFLLVLFSISCSLFSIYYDKKRLIWKKKRTICLYVSGALSVMSGMFYAFMEGKDETVPANSFYFVLVFLILWYSYNGRNTINQHVAYEKKEKEIIEKQIMEKQDKEVQENKRQETK